MMDRDPPASVVSSVRDASRRLVREFGFMGSTLANTNLHASAVHAIIEIGERRVKTATDIGAVLNLEKSAVSRMLRKLIEGGEVKEEQSGTDAREKMLSLTPKGVQTLAAIDSFADRLVQNATFGLSQDTVETILHGLETYATALRAQRLGRPPSPREIKVVSGYQPGLVGRCIELHMAYYAPAHGMGSQFEHKLACGLGDLIPRLDRPMNQAWAAMDGHTIVGTIFIDGESLGENKAHLRAFMVSGETRGTGIGRRLLKEAMSFVDQVGFEETHLYTYRGLDSAMHLYRAYGFHLADEWLGLQWGKELSEQRYVRKLYAADLSC